ncbi:MAG: type II secretion system protein M [Zetaproteobacteria bacterium]|nr:type II secretion system protein M [Zetaproteobacteria bacterium]
MNEIISDWLHSLFQRTPKLQQQWRNRVEVPFHGLQPREQRIVVGAALLLPLLLFVFGVILPLHDDEIALQQRLMVLETQAEEATMLAAQLAGRAAQERFHGDTMGEIDRLAKAHGIRQYLTHIRPQNDGSHPQFIFQMRDVPYAKVMPMLQAIEGMGIAFKKLKIEATKVAGVVHVQAVIGGE